MDGIKDLAQAINDKIDRAQAGAKARLRFVECTAVDWDGKTMDAKGADDGVPYLDVFLGLGSVYVKPAIGSNCLIAMVDGENSVAFLIAAEKVDAVEIESKVVFNGGGNGEMVKIDALTAAMNKLVSAFNTHTHPSNGTPPVKPAAMFNKSDYADTKITH